MTSIVLKYLPAKFSEEQYQIRNWSLTISQLARDCYNFKLSNILFSISRKLTNGLVT